MAWATQGRRTIALFDIHTKESLKIEYWVDGWYNPDALHACNHFLRDWRTDEVADIDLGLLDLLHRINHRTGKPVDVICGYRSPNTNARLARSNRGVAQNSFHTKGKAADIHVDGVSLRGLRSIAREFQMGGVGYYPRSGFVHVDTGPVRTW